MTEYKLFNTDGKTFFDFRSNPESRCEAFTLSFLDDGTVVMSGDYGTLCWKRNYHHEGDKDFNRDYGFPNKDTNIGYFAEKVCQFGIPQQIEEWDNDEAKKECEESLLKDYEISKEEADNWFSKGIDAFKTEEEIEDDEVDTTEQIRKDKIMKFLDGLDFEDEYDMHRQLQQLEDNLGDCCDFWEVSFGKGYSHHFKFMFEILKSVSEQVLEAVREKKNGM